MNFDNMTPHDAAKAIVATVFHEKRFNNPNDVIMDELLHAITTACQHFSNEQLLRNRAVDRQADVAAFFRKFNVPMPETPGWPEQKIMDLRVSLIAEEFCEFLRDAGLAFQVTIGRPLWYLDGLKTYRTVYEEEADGNGKSSLPKAADALIDLQYVCEGALISLGINSNPPWAEVQRANMAKEGGPQREDGKILKPDGWQPPDIAGELLKQGWGGE